MASCSDPSCVSRPSACAAIWSTVVPERMSDPSVFRMCTPLRNEPAPREWSPTPSEPWAFASRFESPLKTTSRSRNGSSGFRDGDSAKPGPLVAGKKCGSDMPFGTYTAPKRRTGRGAAKAGTMPSSSGSASEAPMPRSTVRRESTRRVLIIARSSSETADCPRWRRPAPTSGSRPPPPAA